MPLVSMSRLYLNLLAVTCLFATFVYAQQTCAIEQDISTLPPSARSQLYHGQRNFTFSLLQAITKATPHENVFFSPYSTYHALLLAYFGARSQTEKELSQTLQLQWAGGKKNYVFTSYRLEKMNRLRRAKQMPLKFSSADKIYFDKSIKLTDCVTQIFIDELESMDFQKDSELCRQTINAWIADVTENEIPNMLSAGDITTDTQMVLANAAYFKGQWANKFDSKDTEKKLFYTTHNKTSFVDMMYKRGTYNLATDERLGAYILEIPYQTSMEEKTESEISMIIVLPPFLLLDDVLAKLTAETLEDALKDSMAREVDLWLPKFAFEQNLELVPILRQMGLNSMFDHGADMSDFSASTNINFGDAKHVAKIKVDEEGSTASAATVLFSFRSARPLEPTKFECNHPFLFLIYDHTARAVLFTGVYRDPMTQK